MSKDFYKQFIEPFAGIIIKICRAYTDSNADFEDYYQEVCLQIWRSHQNYRQDSAWSTFVYRITLNVCLTLTRKNKKSKLTEFKDADGQTVENSAFQDESVQQLYHAIKRLKEIDRLIILLYLEEKTYEEIAAVIKSNPNAVGVRIKRIKEKLKKIITSHE